jgi:hypothetical protein
MNQRNMAFSLFAAGATAGLTLTYLSRRARARLRRPIVQAMTVAAPRERVEQFIEARDSMLVALGSKRRLSLIERLELHDAPGARGTEIHLSVRGMGKYQIKDVLRRAKALLEAGEIPTGRRCAT